jgi:DNA-binding CsgD family transcriptional regulator
MSEQLELMELAGVIYDAALKPSLWADVLGRTAEFVGGPGAALFFKDANSENGSLAYDAGIDPHYRKLYFDEYIKLDPSTTGQFFAEIDNPISTTDLIPYDDFRETRFYKEWAQPQGLVECVTTLLDKSSTSVAMFRVFRHERNGLVDEEARRRMRLISPHIRRSVVIGKVLDMRRTEADTFADTLDGLNAGVFFVASCGHIVHANKAGAAMLASGQVVCANRDRLVAANPQFNEALAEAVAAAAKDDIALSAKGISMPLVARDGENYVAHVLPLTSGERQRASASFAATAAVFVHAAALKPTSAPDVIAKTFKLTPTELRTFLAVVEVGGVPEVAQELGISSNTVKTHLQRIFSKTGANRQADLVKLFAGFASPFAS